MKIILTINFRKGYCQSFITPSDGFVKLFQLNAGTCTCKYTKLRLAPTHFMYLMPSMLFVVSREGLFEDLRG